MGFNEHVEAHEQPECVLFARVVDQGFMDDYRAAGRQDIVGLAKKHHLFVQVPVMENVPHDDHIALRQWIFEEIPWVKAHTLCDASRLRIGLEYRLHHRKIHPTARQMLVRQRDLGCHAALRAADIHKRMVLFPGKFFRNDLRRSDAETGHGFEKTFEPLRIGIQGAEEVLAGLDLVLRLACAEAFRQRTPELIEPRITHFEYAANIRSLGSV